MIDVYVDLERVTVTGHAGAGPPGHDIVCAGVSALFLTLAEAAQALTEDKIECDISSGKAEIRYKDPSEKLCLLVDSFYIGICGIRGVHPECFAKAS